jgi:hypothetical protein
MRFAVACLIATSQAIKIKSTACPTDVNEGWTTVVDSTKLWKVGTESCYKTSAPHSCPNTTDSHISSGTYTVESGDCFSTALAQKKSTACPTDVNEGWTTVVDSTKLWKVGTESCYKTSAPHSCPNTTDSHISSGTYTVESGDCFSTALAQKKED